MLNSAVHCIFQQSLPLQTYVGNANATSQTSLSYVQKFAPNKWFQKCVYFLCAQLSCDFEIVV